MPQTCPAVSPIKPRFAMTPIGALQSLGASCTRAEILTYTALELHADKDTGFCWPGRETLAAITGLPENRISKATTSLEKKGFIRKEQPDPFHVHYYVLTPPEVEPIQPLPKARPPLKTRPVPAAEPMPPAEPSPCHAGNEPMPFTAPASAAHGTTKNKAVNCSKTKRAAPPEPEPPAPASPKPERPLPLSASKPTAKTAAPDSIPDDWLETAQAMRPDLTADQIARSASRFLDFHQGKGSEFKDWLPIWRIWISKERPDSPKTAGQRPQATNAERRYPSPEQEAALREDTVRAMEASEQRRIAMLVERGIDPKTGLKLPTAPAAPPTTAPAAPPAATPAATPARPAARPAPPEPEPPPIVTIAPIAETPESPPATPETPGPSPMTTADEIKRNRQIAELVANGATLAEVKVMLEPPAPATAPRPARRLTAEQQAQFIELAKSGLSLAEVKKRMGID